MHQHLARIVSVAVVLLLIGCSGGGGPTTPPVDTQNQPEGLAPAGSAIGLTPNIITSEPEERILGNFYYYSDNGETLAWGTVLINQDGWDYRIDYLAPKLRALRQSEVTREAQAVVDLTWLKLINVGVSYTNKPLPIPPNHATYEPGELMDYRVDIQNKLKHKINNQHVIATQIDMFNQQLGKDAQNIWDDVDIPVSGLSLFDSWIVEPTLPNGIYYTRVTVGFPFLHGWIKILIFDAKAGAFKVEKGVGPEFFDPVAKGVTTTPVVAVGENVHVQDNGSYDPDGGPITLYEWDFNNDGTFDATGPSADTIYYTPGVYYINLRVTDDEGAKDDLTDDPGDQLIEVTVTPPPVPPVAIASASKYEAYVDEDITFTGTDSYDPDGGDIVLYEWDWDNDGTYDSLGGVVDHSYSTAGTYYVQLKVTDDELQTDTLDEPLEIVITPAPIAPNACFTYDPESPVPCEYVTFDATCSSDEDGEIVKYAWDFDGDGEVDLETENPIVEVPAGVPGDYNVILTVTDDSGLQDQAQDTVTVVNALPTAVLTVDKTEAYVGEDIAFNACDSHDDDCEGEEIVAWDFYWDKDGEPVGSQECTTIHAYDTPGVYKVDVRVTDDEGGTDRLDEGTWPEITILAQPEAPIAIADADPKTQTVCEPVHFFDDGSYDPDGGLIVSYEWDWNGDGVYEDVGDDTYHSFTAPGDYFVQFRVTDDEGQTDTLDEPIHIIVQNALPTAVASADKYTAQPDEVINFDGSDSHDNDCDMQEIVKWEWDWENDGSYEGSGEIAEHAYTEPGTYYVQLMVTDNENGTDTLDEPLEIVVSLDLFDPIAYAKASTNSTTVCYSIYFQDDGSYDPDGGDIQLYEWDWDGDGTFDESGQALYHTFTVPGNYDVQFRVTDDEGAAGTLDSPLAITIENALPTAVAYASSYNVYVNETVTFDGSDSYDNDCEGSEIVLWEWDWDNDGNYDATGAVAEHAFDEPGIYPVMLRVTDDEGGTDTLDEPLQITVSVQYFDPIAYAKADTTQTTVCYSIFFQDDGSYDPDGGDIQLYEWDWDNDGTFDESGKDVYHSFDTPGNYEVQFQVTDDEGATDTLDAPIQILIENALPTAVASASKYEAYVGELIDFDGSGSYDNDCDGEYIAAWEWDWENDGVFEGSGEFASHSYSAPGIYPVQLRVTDNEGGTDTLDVPLSINIIELEYDPIAFAAASPNPQIVCEQVHLFDDGSYDPDGGSIQLFEWDIDNDGTYEYTGSDIYYAWTVPGTYYVQMRVTDDEGATDTLDTPLEIMIENSLPTAVGSASKYEAYVGELIDFDGSGSYDNDCDGEYIAAWEWDWTNDGVFEGSGEYASHSFTAPGQFEVQLRVTDNEGGTDTLDATLSINVTEEKFDPIAYAAASPNPQTVCEDVHLYDDGSYDPDGGSIQLFEWDIDNDGTYEYTGSGIYYAWTVPGTYYVQMRVTDDEGATDTLNTPLEIHITNALPSAYATVDKDTAEIGELFYFDGSGSHDNDCDGQVITTWEWDFDYDGTFDLDDNGKNVSHAYDTPGDYQIMLRVTDDEGGTNLLGNPLEVTVTLPTCPEGIHYFDVLDPASRRGLSHGYSTFAFSVLPRADIAFIEAGSMAGLGIVQGGQNSLVTFDPDVDADDPINDGIFVKPTGGAKGAVLVTNLDGAPYDSMVSVVTSDKPNELRLLDTSVIAGMFFPFSYSFGAGYKIMAVDFGESSDIWAVVQRPAGSGIDLMYSAYVGDPVFYQTWHATSIGSIIGTETDVFDIAVNWAAGKLYIFDAGTDQRGRVTVFDISNPLSPSVSMTANAIFDSAIDYSYSEEFGVAGFADIDIDHVGSDETCHILVYARIGGTTAQLQKFDQYMSPLGISNYQGAVWPTFTINPETMPEDRDLVLPGTSKLGFWFAPADW